MTRFRVNGRMDESIARFSYNKVMSRIQYRVFGLMILLSVLAGGPVGADPATVEQADNRLFEAGLSNRTSDALADLESSGGRRAPSMTVDDTVKLSEAGFSEDMILHLIELDRSTLDREAPVITPGQALDLKAGGVGLDTLDLMVGMEIERAKGTAVGAEHDPNRIGREEAVLPNGKRVITYYSGDPNARQDKGPGEQEEENLRRAWKMLENLRIEVHPRVSD